MFKYSDFENLTPATVQAILAGRSAETVSPEVRRFVLELDAAARLFRGNVTKAARALLKECPHLTFRTARERIYDAVRYLNAGEKSLPAREWYHYYADRYEELAALYARSPDTVRYAKGCFDAALECRLKTAGSGVPEELLNIRTFLVSPDISTDRLSITEINLRKAFEDGMKLIGSFDIPETERKRIGKELQEELGVIEDAEIMNADGQ
jgi:hypothetical protein